MVKKSHNRIEPFVNRTQPSQQKLEIRPAVEERTATGQFTTGCKPGPGNPFAKRVATLRKALLDSITEDDIKQLSKNLLAQANAGDVAAAKVLLSYVIGKPTSAVDPDRVALEAWKLIASWPMVAEVLAAAWGVRPEIAATFISHNSAATTNEFLEQAATPTPIEGAERIRKRKETKGK